MPSNATKNRIMWIALLACTVGVVGIVYFTDLATDSTAPDPAEQSQPLTGIPPSTQGFIPAPQPPGEVPPGKVWNEPHGHWHDSGQNLQTTITPQEGSLPGQTFTPAPQPPGEPPPGKVWNEPHGHWHDAPTQSTTTTPTSILPGVPPPTPPPTFTPAPQPPGEPPAGKVWNEPHGHWHDAPGASQTPTIKQIDVEPKDSP